MSLTAQGRIQLQGELAADLFQPEALSIPEFASLKFASWGGYGKEKHCRNRR